MFFDLERIAGGRLRIEQYTGHKETFELLKTGIPSVNKDNAICFPEKKKLSDLRWAASHISVITCISSAVGKINELHCSRES